MKYQLLAPALLFLPFCTHASSLQTDLKDIFYQYEFISAQHALDKHPHMVCLEQDQRALRPPTELSAGQFCFINPSNLSRYMVASEDHPDGYSVLFQHSEYRYRFTYHQERQAWTISYYDGRWHHQGYIDSTVTPLFIQQFTPQANNFYLTDRHYSPATEEEYQNAVRVFGEQGDNYFGSESSFTISFGAEGEPFPLQYRSFWLQGQWGLHETDRHHLRQNHATSCPALIEDGSLMIIYNEDLDLAQDEYESVVVMPEENIMLEYISWLPYLTPQSQKGSFEEFSVEQLLNNQNNSIVVDLGPSETQPLYPYIPIEAIHRLFFIHPEYGRLFSDISYYPLMDGQHEVSCFGQSQ